MPVLGRRTAPNVVSLFSFSTKTGLLNRTSVWAIRMTAKIKDLIHAQSNPSHMKIKIGVDISGSIFLFFDIVDRIFPLNNASFR